MNVRNLFDRDGGIRPFGPTSGSIGFWPSGVDHIYGDGTEQFTGEVEEQACSATLLLIGRLERFLTCVLSVFTRLKLHARGFFVAAITGWPSVVL